MTIDYHAQTRNCRTENQFNRVHIDLFSIMTPDEFADLFRQAEAGLLPGRVGKWLAPMARHCPQILTMPEPYERTEINDHLSWLRSAGKPVGGKAVLLLVCGNADRPMMPLPLFLQALPAAGWDVLKVIRPTHPGPRYEKLTLATRLAEMRAALTGETHRRYLRPGRETSDFQSLTDEIATALRGVAASEVVCLGNSAGGWVALFVAHAIKARRCVVLSGDAGPTTLSLVQTLKAEMPATGQAAMDIVHTFGADSPQDRANAETAQSIWGGRLLGFPGIKEHATLFPLIRQGLFYATLGPLLTGASLPSQIAADDKA
jgi:hypothetical protein